MIYRLLFIALLISVLPSCTHEFSLTEVDAERKIVLFCMPSTLGDTTLIQVARTTRKFLPVCFRPDRIM